MILNEDYFKELDLTDDDVPVNDTLGDGCPD
jgi:hypothetical protein